ncbi:hypothetical protein DBR06_SOUSAS13410027, partial [Sousa chinensis]
REAVLCLLLLENLFSDTTHPKTQFLKYRYKNAVLSAYRRGNLSAGI